LYCHLNEKLAQSSIFRDKIFIVLLQSFKQKYYTKVLKTLLHGRQFEFVIARLAHQLVENNPKLKNIVLVGLQPRGVFFSERVHHYVAHELGIKDVPYGKLDITLYRDDATASESMRVPSATEMNFSVDGADVVLIDDVLHTGRTIRSAMDALLDYGRPKSVQLMVLIDRRFSRELPIQPDYVGQSIDSIIGQKVKVLWLEKDNKDEVILIDN
jgi:pyrimidine operon attenuation protein / uracil phosphoribosyltransferase